VNVFYVDAQRTSKTPGRKDLYKSLTKNRNNKSPEIGEKERNQRPSQFSHNTSHLNLKLKPEKNTDF